jgi:hypothetical protein
LVRTAGAFASIRTHSRALRGPNDSSRSTISSDSPCSSQAFAEPAPTAPSSSIGEPEPAPESAPGESSDERERRHPVVANTKIARTRSVAADEERARVLRWPQAAAGFRDRDRREADCLARPSPHGAGSEMALTAGVCSLSQLRSARVEDGGFRNPKRPFGSCMGPAEMRRERKSGERPGLRPKVAIPR